VTPTDDIIMNTRKSLFAILFAVLCAAALLAALSFETVSAFQSIQPAATTFAGVRHSASSSSALNVFGNKKSDSAAAAARAEEDSKYWQGEWVCKDCGYIYNRVSTRTTVCPCVGRRPLSGTALLVCVRQ